MEKIYSGSDQRWIRVTTVYSGSNSNYPMFSVLRHWWVTLTFMTFDLDLGVVCDTSALLLGFVWLQFMLLLSPSSLLQKCQKEVLLFFDISWNVGHIFSCISPFLSWDVTRLFEISCPAWFLRSVWLVSTFLSQGSHSDWKTWKMGRHFPVRKFRTDWKRRGKITHKLGKSRKFWQIFSDI